MTMMLTCYLNLSIFSSMEFLLVVLLVLGLFLFLFSDWVFLRKQKYKKVATINKRKNKPEGNFNGVS